MSCCGGSCGGSSREAQEGSGNKRFFKCDMHTHILPREWPDFNKKYGEKSFVSLVHFPDGRADMMQGEKFFRTVEPNCFDIEARIADCDRDGVDLQVLSTVPVMFSYWAKPQDALEVSQFLNDHLAGVCRAHPNRFVGLGTIPMQAPELAIQELRRCVLELGMPGVQIGTHVEGKNLDDPSLFPIFQEAEKIGAAIFIHPWDMMAPERMANYWTSWLVGMPAETCLCMCALIMGGVFERLPNLKVCFAHAGGSFPGTFGRIVHGFEVRPDLCAKVNPVHPATYLGKFYVDSLTHSPEMLKIVVDMFGADKVVLGTDFPFPLGELEPGKLIESSEYDDETKKKLLSTNCLDFLGIPHSRFLPDSTP